jgi:aspartate racemase
MKAPLLGVVGGMAWPSTAYYYEQINRTSNLRLGGKHTARVMIDSLNFGELEMLGNQQGQWNEVIDRIVGSAQRLEREGAEVVLLASHTAHLFAEQVQTAVSVPLVHVADALAKHCAYNRWQQVAIFGNRHVANSDMLTLPLELKQIRSTDLPGSVAEDIDRLVFAEIDFFHPPEAVRLKFRDWVGTAHLLGAQAIVLACTEFCVLGAKQLTQVPLIDTVQLHVNAALDAVCPR